jgi:hypothetical protein
MTPTVWVLTLLHAWSVRLWALLRRHTVCRIGRHRRLETSGSPTACVDCEEARG